MQVSGTEYVTYRFLNRLRSSGLASIQLEILSTLRSDKDGGWNWFSVARKNRSTGDNEVSCSL